MSSGEEELFDKAEASKVGEMSALEREMIVYRRMEENEIKKKREQLRQKLSTAKAEAESKKSRKRPKKDADEDSDHSADAKSYSSSSDSEGEIREPKRSSTHHASSDAEYKEADPDMDYHRPSEVHEKRSKKKAMDALLSKRRDKKEAGDRRKEGETSTEGNRAVLDFDAIFGGVSKRRSTSSATSSSRSSSRSSGLSSRSRSATPESKREINDGEELRSCTISRFRLSKFVHLPFFNKLAIGCYVRIGIGQNNGRSVYRVAEITDVVETSKVYSVENTRTNKGVKLKHGVEQRVYRLEFISNTPFTPNEFTQWTQAMRSKNVPLPTLNQVTTKAKEISHLTSAQLSSTDFDYMIREKQRFLKAPTNIAIEKSRLMKAKVDAEDQSNLERVKEIQHEIDELDARADQAESQRNAKLSAVTYINQKRRVEMKQNFLTTKRPEMAEVRQDDPFTRKSNRTKVVSGVAKRRDGDPTSGGDSQLAEDNTLNASGVASTSSAVPPGNFSLAETSSAASSAPASVQRITISKSLSWQQKMATSAKQFAHHTDIELDIEI